MMKKQITIYFEEYDNILGFTDLEQKMLEKAYLTCENAYSPYSNFKVGASVLLSNGEVLAGSNQENIAYPSGMCAERVALFYAGANFPDEKISTIVVISRGDMLSEEQIISPCGGCRQVMIESEKRQGNPIKVILSNRKGKSIVFSSVADLLPFAFGL